jgi:hypothetical protein
VNSAPPKINSGNARFAGIILASVVLGIVAVVFFFNPATHTFYPVCQFHRLTGLNCPGCGMTRALYALLHGKILTALRDNSLFILVLGVLIIRVAWFSLKKFRGVATGEFFPVKFLWALLMIALVFTVLRNLPAFKFLSPPNQ